MGVAAIKADSRPFWALLYAFMSSGHNQPEY